MSKVIVPWDLITNFVTDAFIGYGIPAEDAKICTDVLLESDRRGIESHGCNRFKPIYLDRIKAGIQNPVTQFEILKETPTTAVVDGHNGMGQVIGHRAMQMAIDKAKAYGMGTTVLPVTTPPWPPRPAASASPAPTPAPPWHPPLVWRVCSAPTR